MYFLNTRRYKQSVYNYTLTSADIGTFNDTTLNIMVPTGARIGDIDFSNTTKIPPPNTLIPGNLQKTDGMLGASVQLCGIWNFYADPGFNATSIPSATGQGVSDQCLTYAYSSLYCVYCPLPSNYQLSNTPQVIQRFSYPYKYEVSSNYEYYLSYSNNYGNLSAVSRNALSINLFPVSPKLRVKNLILINDMVSDPVNLVSNSVNNRLTFSFIAASTFQKNSIITIAFTSTHPFVTSSPATVTCLFVNTYNSTCTIAFPNANNLTITLSGSGADFSAVINSYIILTGLDILDIASNTSYSYDYSISDGTNTLQTVWLTDVGTFNVNTSDLTFSPQFSLNHISPLAFSALSITFNLPKTLFLNEVIVINLGSLNIKNSNQLSELDCSGNAGGVYASQCDTSSGSAILVTFAEEIPASTNFNITLSYIFVPEANFTADYSVTIRRPTTTTVMTAVGNNVYFDSNNGINQAASPLVLTKRYNNPGDVLELEFDYTLQNTMNYSTTLRIYFPAPYYQGLGYNLLYCTIQNQYTHCSQSSGDPRLLEFTPVNTTIAAGQTIKINIYGLRQPLTVSYFPIFLTHDLDNNFTIISEYAFVADVGPNDAPDQLTFTFFNSTVQSLLTTTTYQFNFTAPSTTDSSLTLIAINFPDMNDPVISNALGFTCTLLDHTNASIPVTNCTTYGNRVKVFLGSAVTASEPYGLYLQEFPNPSQQICNMSKITLSLVTTDETNTKYYSYPNTMNAQYLSLRLDPSVKVLGVYANSNLNNLSMVGPTQILTTIVGVYSQIYYLAPISGDPYIKDVNFSLLNSAFSMIKTPNTTDSSVKLGDTTFPFRLGLDSSRAPSIYQLTILKSESGSTQTYTTPPQLTINAINSTVNITPADTTASIGGGNTLPITFDLSDNIPFDNLTITAVIPSNSTDRITFLTSSTIVFNTTNTQGYFQFSTSSALVQGSTATVLFTLGGTNQNIYNLAKWWVMITITAGSSGGPKILVRQPIVSNCTSQSLSIYTSQVSTIYWAVALYGAVIRDCYYIYNASTNNFTYNATDPMQEQFGIASATTAATDVAITVGNLRANASYQIYACALNQQFYNSSTQSNSWTMENNNSTVIRGSLFFQFSLAAYQEQQLSCFIANYFYLNYENVRSPRNIICTNTSTTSSSGTSSSRLLPVTNVDINDNFQGDENVWLLYGSTNTETADPRTDNIMSAFNQSDGGAFYAKLQAYLAHYPGFPPLISIDYSGNLTGNPSEITGTLTVEAQESWAAMLDFQLDNNGFIYAIVDLLTSQTPSYLQVKAGLNASGLPAVQNTSLFMYGGQNYSINFSSLPGNTSYVLFFYTTSEDQTIFAPTSGVYAVPVNTTGSDVVIDVWVGAQKLSFSTLIVLLSMAVLIFV